MERWPPTSRVALALLIAATAHPAVASARPLPDTPPAGDGAAPRLITLEEEIARQARRMLRERPRLPREDCSGFLEAVLAASGVRRRGSVRMFWQRALEEGRAYRGGAPAPGHIVFFDTSYDANKNGHVDDTLTHVAVVTAVHPDGTIEMVHRPRGGIRALRMNLRAPSTHKQLGALRNDYLRAPGFGEPSDRRLTAQLWYGFAAPPSPFPIGCSCVCDAETTSVPPS